MFWRSFLIIIVLICGYLFLLPKKRTETSVVQASKQVNVNEVVIEKPLLMSPVLEISSPVIMPVPQYEVDLPVIEDDWDDSMYELLIELDPHDGEKIYKAYMEEKLRYQEDLNLNLVVQLNTLSTLNGESLDDFQKEKIEEGPIPVMMLELNHKRQVREILGPHYADVIHRYEMDHQ